MVEKQVGEIRQFSSEAMQALAREEIALEKLTGPSGNGNDANAEDAYLLMSKLVAQTVEFRETYSRGHSERVALLAKDIAMNMSCTDTFIEDVQLAALVHDIGKIIIPDHILFKPGRLTSAEYSEIKAHPGTAVDLIRHVDRFNEVIPMVESHHEFYNGKGYPKKLKGKNIPLGARILSVANAYDAMTCTRPYRPRHTNEEAIRILKKGAGAQWDPVVIDAFLQTLRQDSEMLPASLATG
jgi:HD-GYP domain-containing protein (c-di-GMP phosphodiesterase class II)